METGVLRENHDMLSPRFYLSKDLNENFTGWIDKQCEPSDNWFTITELARQGKEASYPSLSA